MTQIDAPRLPPAPFVFVSCSTCPYTVLLSHSFLAAHAGRVAALPVFLDDPLLGSRSRLLFSASEMPLKLSQKVGLGAAFCVWLKQGGLASLPHIYEHLSNVTRSYAQELAEDPAASFGKVYTGLLESPVAVSLLLYVLCRVLAHLFKGWMIAARKQAAEEETAATAAATAAPAAAAKKKRK